MNVHAPFTRTALTVGRAGSEGDPELEVVSWTIEKPNATMLTREPEAWRSRHREPLLPKSFRPEIPSWDLRRMLTGVTGMDTCSPRVCVDYGWWYQIQHPPSSVIAHPGVRLPMIMDLNCEGADGKRTTASAHNPTCKAARGKGRQGVAPASIQASEQLNSVREMPSMSRLA